MNQSRLLAENGLYRLLNVAVVFGINILVTRLADVAGYGFISLLVANASIFSLVTALGSDAAVSYHAASSRLSAQKLMGFLAWITIGQLILAFLVDSFMYFRTGHYWFLSTKLTSYGWIGLMYVASVIFTEKYAALLNGSQQFSRFSITMLLSNTVIGLVLLGLFIFNSTIELPDFLKWYAGLYLLQSVLLGIAWHTSGKHPVQMTGITEDDRKLFFSYSLLAFFINCIQFLAYRVDYWLLDFYHGKLSLGWYSLAVRLSQFFWVLPLVMAGMIAPLVAADKSGQKPVVPVVLRWLNLLNIVTGAVLFIFADWFIMTLFGSYYDRSVVLFRILLPGVILFCNATIIAAWYAGRNQLAINLGASFLCLSVILVLDLLLIPERHMKGAAYASSIGYGLTGIYYIIVYTVKEKTPLWLLFLPLKGDLTEFKKSIKPETAE